jgi:ketoreductase RED1
MEEAMQQSPQWNNVAVVGAGTIGLAWAALFSARGCEVHITDPRDDVDEIVRESIPMLAASMPGRPRDLLDRIEVTDKPAYAVEGADLIQENGPERLGLKQELFAEIAEHAPKHAVFASSSSGIVATAIAEDLPDDVAARLLIAHPFNPPHLLPLVEIVPGDRTSERTTESAIEFYRALGKTPVRLHKEIPGFVANRLQSAVLQEAFHLVLEGVVGADELDTVMTASLGRRWATVGPFEGFHLGGGPGGIRHMIEHLGVGMAESWKGLGRPRLTGRNIELLADETEAAYGTGPSAYHARAERRDRKQVAVNAALEQTETQ